MGHGVEDQDGRKGAVNVGGKLLPDLGIFWFRFFLSQNVGLANAQEDCLEDGAKKRKNQCNEEINNEKGDVHGGSPNASLRETKAKSLSKTASVVGVNLANNNPVFHLEEDALAIWFTVFLGVHEKAHLIIFVFNDDGTVTDSVAGVVPDEGFDDILSGHSFFEIVVEAAIGAESWVYDPWIESEEKENRRDEDAASGEDEHDAGPSVFSDSECEEKKGYKNSQETEVGVWRTERSFHG